MKNWEAPEPTWHNEDIAHSCVGDRRHDKLIWSRHLAQVCRSSKEKLCTWQDDRAETPGTDLRGKSKKYEETWQNHPSSHEQKQVNETKLACKSGGKVDLQSCGDKMGAPFQRGQALYKALGNFETQSGSAAVPTMCIKYKT